MEAQQILERPGFVGRQHERDVPAGGRAPHVREERPLGGSAAPDVEHDRSRLVRSNERLELRLIESNFVRRDSRRPKPLLRECTAQLLHRSGIGVEYEHGG